MSEHTSREKAPRLMLWIILGILAFALLRASGLLSSVPGVPC